MFKCFYNNYCLSCYGVGLIAVLLYSKRELGLFYNKFENLLHVVNSLKYGNNKFLKLVTYYEITPYDNDYHSRKLGNPIKVLFRNQLVYLVPNYLHV